MTLLEQIGALHALHTCLVISPHWAHARRLPRAGLLGEGSELETDRASSLKVPGCLFLVLLGGGGGGR